MNAFCQVCGKQWDAEDPAVAYDRNTGEWRCHDEAACGLRAVDKPGWCGQPEPATGVGCQRPPAAHDGLRHAAITVGGGKILVREW